MPLWASSLLLSSHINLKKREDLYTEHIHLIQYLYVDQILLSNLFDSSQRRPLKFFLTSYQKSFNSILKFFTQLFLII